MFKLALRSLWCDLKHSLKGIEIIGFIVYAVLLILPSNSFFSSYFYFIWLFEISMRRFMPVCEKMYFVLPISEKDRKKLMGYRTGIVAGVLLLIVLLNVLIQYIAFGLIGRGHYIYLTFLILLLFEMFWTFCFCEYIPKLSDLQKGLSIFLAIAIFFVYFVGMFGFAVFSEELSPVGIMLTLAAWAAFLFMRVYYMRRARYEEYRRVDYMTIMKNGSKVKKEQEW